MKVSRGASNPVVAEVTITRELLLSILKEPEKKGKWYDNPLKQTCVFHPPLNFDLFIGTVMKLRAKCVTCEAPIPVNPRHKWESGNFCAECNRTAYFFSK